MTRDKIQWDFTVSIIALKLRRFREVRMEGSEVHWTWEAA